MTPGGQKITKTGVSATLQQYGDITEISDVIQDTHEDNALDEAVTLCSEQLADTIEVVRIAKIKAGSNVFYANNVASRATVNSPPLAGDLKRIVRAFNRRKARPISSIVKAGAGVATEPIGSSFFAMCHTDLIPDLRNMAGFVDVKNYSNSDKALPGEVGSRQFIRFVPSALFEPWLLAATSSSGTTYLSNGEIVSTAGYPDVYPIIVVSQNAYGIEPAQQYSPERRLIG